MIIYFAGFSGDINERSAEKFLNELKAKAGEVEEEYQEVKVGVATISSVYIII